MNQPTQQSKKLVERFAERFGIDPEKLLHTLKVTAFRQRGEKVATTEQLMALLIVAEQYNLNPWTKEIFAFDDKNMGIIPVVSVDGWTRLINSHRDYDGLEFHYSDTIAKMTDGKPCPEWCEVRVYRKGMGRPIVIREYLDEVYVGKRNGYPGPWQSHTKRMLRHKTLIQGGRVAFGFAGIYDEDEANRIIDGESVRISTTTAGGANTSQLQQELAQRAQAIEHEANPLNDVDTREREPVVIEGELVGEETAAQAEAVETDAKPTAAELVYDSEGPSGLSAMIADATEQVQLDELLAVIAAIPEEDIRKPLTRELLARKTELIA